MEPRWYNRLRERREADRHLRATGALPPRLAWRAAELTSPRERRTLARSLRDVAELARREYLLPNASPVNRRGLRDHLDGLRVLADELDDLALPVTSAGVLLVRDLLSDGGSPLYLAGRVEDLEATIARIRVALTEQPLVVIAGRC